MIQQIKKLCCSVPNCPAIIQIGTHTAGPEWMACSIVSRPNCSTQTSGRIALCPTHRSVKDIFSTGDDLERMAISNPDRGVFDVKIWQCDAPNCSTTAEQVLTGKPDQPNPKGWILFTPSGQCFCPKHNPNTSS